MNTSQLSSYLLRSGLPYSVKEAMFLKAASRVKGFRGEQIRHFWDKGGSPLTTQGQVHWVASTADKLDVWMGTLAADLEHRAENEVWNLHNPQQNITLVWQNALFALRWLGKMESSGKVVTRVVAEMEKEEEQRKRFFAQFGKKKTESVLNTTVLSTSERVFNLLDLKKKKKSQRVSRTWEELASFSEKIQNDEVIRANLRLAEFALEYLLPNLNIDRSKSITTAIQTFKTMVEIINIHNWVMHRNCDFKKDDAVSRDYSELLYSSIDKDSKYLTSYNILREILVILKATEPKISEDLLQLDIGKKSKEANIRCEIEPDLKLRRPDFLIYTDGCYKVIELDGPFHWLYEIEDESVKYSNSRTCRRDISYLISGVSVTRFDSYQNNKITGISSDLFSDILDPKLAFAIIDKVK